MNIITLFQRTFQDTAALTWRNAIQYKRLPQLIIFSLVQPIMFVLLFVYVFGGAIQGSSKAYVQFLLPGIIVQTLIFGSVQTGIGLAYDITRGVIDRFRSMPIVSSAVLVARAVTDALRNIVMIITMVGIGYLIGFRIENGLLNFVAAMAMGLGIGFAFSWVSAFIGLAAKNVETAQGAGFIWMFPLVFASSIFVPVETMPTWLQAFAEHSPITVTVNTVRALTLGTPVGSDWWQALLWIAGILCIFVPMAVRQYQKSE